MLDYLSKLNALIADVKANGEYYIWEKEFLSEIQNYETKESFWIGSVMKKLAEKHNWGRRTAFAFIRGVTDSMDDDQLESEILIDDLGDLLTIIQAECASESVMRFKNDPENPGRLWKYVHTMKWLDEEFYTE